MRNFARVSDGAVVEIITLPDDIGIESAVHPSIATTCVACDADVAAGWTYDGATFSPPVPSAANLARIKDALSQMVDVRAEAERAKYITPGAGQAMSYMAKAQQATDYLAAVAPDDGDYPLLAAEVGITGDTVAGVAGIVNAAYQSWLVIGAQIEAARLAAKRDIAAAETAEAAQAVYHAIAWPVAPQ